ncbi:ubiquinol-cytochrome C chaperone family protein [Tsuneonella sp. CC-YZS046]|uniref:ubiquinol-cytochrome C chaperone family protein n=1 Tax=Tsuneonella sp. CC-YZS046 TaxID=3042152 RepID=UPI002D771A32|nr:ubiquinol-cytochrome C chaperone family protein [Tsuneonella sp. CC-YZS046]WRO65351.1 ubiquinol-cytochrome C chaperone family protein [Tsuneonella sp. CC-YZS046]
MSVLSRLFRPRPNPRDALRPLWHRVVEIAREKEWYARHRVADTVAGRFDMITAVLSMVLVRMESDPDLVAPSVYLTELFVEDMDGQLREAGVGDVVVGKHIGRQMSVLGGRLGAYREGLEQGDGVLSEAVSRNISLLEPSDSAALAAALRKLAQDIAATDPQELLAGNIAR